MRAILLIGCAALALSACGGAQDEVDEANVMTADNVLMDQNMMMDQNAMGAGGLDANVATNAATENMMMNDLTTNEADTNLANGL